MASLDGKVALITGGSSGIGLASAIAFSNAGARVIVTGRKQSSLYESLDLIGPDSIGICGDISDLTHHDNLVSAVKEHFGSLDIYMANAGINHIEPTEAVTAESYDAQFSANTRGTFFGVQKMLPMMNDGGSILLTSSIASDKVLDGHAVYAGTKAAINAFAKSWAIELKHRNIRVNVLSPGPVETGILDKLGIPQEKLSDFTRTMAQAIPLGRMGHPSELGRAALFLASDDSSFVNGVNLQVDGGMTLL
ncbi:short-chain dehydrogenase [Halomonas cupida]|jgi:NAD(P)-dependent dehydrogenase (short-subunit alcohol dehydrogenase family)|uniref:NAD(P)-dependent dehydrogenase, short-chain alcohol dehydrogenase family n=1 Tax=Halomonas cupida TaxID=44933 RepID=A0A1M7ES30_9GAMM|nr:glucose 1-dehydrogenase [Halomonas cupida]GEN23235.1 short-chain dehydrogenase [Halomonas cupida]SHL94534.1 NAD(P)-dependent dehydrogenase, short-chain alcohol dehydrogenase family [Halomonas cupida]